MKITNRFYGRRSRRKTLPLSSFSVSRPMSIFDLHHVQLAMPPGGEDRARKFYGEVLGLPEVEKPEHLRSRGGVWFETGEVRIHLGVEVEFRPARKAHPAFLVGDLKQLASRCCEAGFSLLEDSPLEGYDRIYVADPFGNRIELMQERDAG